ncbi:MAG: SBBP repeat-containing protein [Candidatus Aminicenantes bacterium]|nr:SBBP repeat-containing protein [Candidatus Aminicenantes bacterium]
MRRIFFGLFLLSIGTIFVQAGRSRDFGKVPLYFIPNRGQVHKKAAFYAGAPGYTLWLTREGLVFDGIGKKGARDISRLIFIKSNKNPQIVSVEPTRYRVNYINGQDRSEWRQNIPTSKAVRYKNLYKNIDLKVYGIERQVEYDWIVKPGGDPADIKFAYKNVKSTRIDEKGNLLIEMEFGELVHHKPVSYQVGAQCAVPGIPIDVKFKRLCRDSYGFAVGNYDKNRELVIDPVITMGYSTYLGGNGYDGGCAVAVDGKGCAYVTGNTKSTNFPLKNSYPGTSRSDLDIFVTKFSPSGNSLVYSTYIGGCRYDQATDIAVDQAGNAYITGFTQSLNFPTKNAFQWYLKIISYYDCYGLDAFVTKLSKDGGDLVYSTYIGGDDEDESWGIAVDNRGCAYITGSALDFPIKNPIEAGTYGSFITKFSPAGNTLVYSTYFSAGGSDIAVDIHGDVYAAGRKISKISSSGRDVIYSTSLDESGATSISSICVDRTGCAYITGYRYNWDSLAANSVRWGCGGGGSDIFIAKLSGDGHSFEYATLLGGSDREYGKGIAVDEEGCAYVTGTTYSVDFPVKDPLQDIRGGGDNDSFVVKIAAAGNKLLYSTYLGGRGNEDGTGIAVDAKGNAYVTGKTTSPDFPTRNSFQEYQYASDAYVTKLHCDEPPAVSITSPGSGSVLSGPVVIRAKAEDDTGVSRVNFYVDNELHHTDNQAPFTYRWDSFRFSNGTHKIKAVVVDTANQQAEDEITVISRNLILTLRVSREQERAWLVSRDYGKIDLTVENPTELQAARYIFYRKESFGLYRAIREIPGAELQGETYSFNDLYLEKGKTYIYKAEALDSKGVLIGLSKEKSTAEASELRKLKSGRFHSTRQ